MAFLLDFEKRQVKAITHLLDKHIAMFLHWHKVISQEMKRKDVVFYKPNWTDFVFCRADLAHNLPLLFIDTPVGSYAFYYTIPVESKPRATIYKYVVSPTPVKEDREYIKKTIEADDYYELNPLYLYNKEYVNDFRVDYDFYVFLKYVVFQRVPIDTKYKKYTIQEQVERYYFDRYNKII